MLPLTALVVSEGAPTADNLHTALRQAGIKAWQVRPEALAAGLFLDPCPDLILLSANLEPDHVDGIRTAAAALDVAATMIVFGEHDAEHLDEHLATGLDYLVPPFVPELVGRRLTICHQNRVLSESLEDMSTDASLLKYERELQIGREIQHGFLPSTLPAPEGWDLQVRFNPAREVAGDFYDSFYLVNGRRISLVIADVCDKGVGAALFMALIRTLIRHTATHGTNQHPLSVVPAALRSVTGTAVLPGSQAEADDLAAAETMLTVGAGPLLSAVTGTDGYMTDNHLAQGYFATLFFAILDPATGHVIYINGGHNPPVLVSADGERTMLHPTGPAVGIFPGSTFEIGELTMQQDDALFLYTDGVTEARSLTGEFFGEERMFDVLKKEPITSSVSLLDRMDAALLGHVGAADQFDDITMMALLRTGA